MTKSSSSTLKKELAALPIARIETMDQSYVLPLREYLFTNGCQVFVNSGPTENVTYLFIVGDSNFVKKTLAFRHDLGKKQLILCWDPDEHASIGQFLGPRAKIIYIDPVALDPSLLSSIFMFLFTTKGKELDLQAQFSKKVKEESLFDEYHKNELLETVALEPNEPLVSPSSETYEKFQKIRIAKTIGDMFGVKHDSSVSRKDPSVTLKKFKKTLSSQCTKIFLPAVILFLVPFLLYIGSFLIRGFALIRASNNFQNGKAEAAIRNVKNEHLWSGYSHFPMTFVHPVLRILAGDTTVQSYERIDKIFDNIGEVESELLTMNDAILSIGSSFLPDPKNTQRLSPVVAIDTIHKSMPSIKNKLNLAAANIRLLSESSVFPFSLSIVKEKMAIVLEKLDKLRRIAEVGERVSQIFPYIGGFRDKQNILVLLQNSGELRPTGGFIGSLAHLAISEGMIEEFRIEDVYTLDGQLKGHVNPPAPIKDLLGQEHWYLRDSNWNPDFEETAKNVRFFYEKETGKNIDGVVGLTSSFIVKILRIVGPVDIPLYNDRITADNFYLKSLYYTQANFFPGSTQKKDFLGALMEALLSKLQTHAESGIAIMGIIHDSLMSHDIQWYTANPEGEDVFKQFGWGGKTPAGTACLTTENQPPCVFSYLYVNEANVSVNKVNSFIDRSQTRTIQISPDGKTTETVVRKIRNLSQGESGSGVYTAYVRLFFPVANTLTGLTIDGKPVPMKDENEKKQTLPYGELDMTIPGVTGIALAFEVEPGRERIISASTAYKETMLSGTKEGLMTIYEQKQPGVDSVPTTTSIEYPAVWNAQMFSPVKNSDVIANKGYLRYNTNLQTDSEFSVRFIR